MMTRRKSRLDCFLIAFMLPLVGTSPARSGLWLSTTWPSRTPFLALTGPLAGIELISTNAVPEPSSIGMLALGFLATVGFLTRRRLKNL